ncbi:MAG TPA: aminotransferase class IV [Planctomycetota bacterium]|nr:aminotransferase class IV [Planctomycetota bacterium]
MTNEPLVHDGRGVVPAHEARVPILDHGFLYGDSVYEVVRTANGRPFMLEEHLERMRRSAAMIYFEMPWPDAEIRTRLLDLRAALRSQECYFRIIATRGPGPISLLPDGCTEPGLYLIGTELPRFPERLYTEGCRVAIVRRLRNDPRALDPRAKTGNYLNNMLGLVEAKRQGAEDALFLNAEGHLTEATTANAWIVEKGRVVTPPIGEGLLEGITRGWLLRALPEKGVPAAEGAIGLDRLHGADEVFLSGTVKGVMPVTVIDGKPVGTGKPGPVARRGMEIYEAALACN